MSDPLDLSYYGHPENEDDEDDLIPILSDNREELT